MLADVRIVFLFGSFFFCLQKTENGVMIVEGMRECREQNAKWGRG
jgi:hypothetical protein